jgi:hypothetical protein
MKNSKFSSSMKLASYFLAASLLTPAALVFGLGAVAAFSLSVTAGMFAIVINDYSKIERGTAALVSRKGERHPLAA